MPYPGVPSNLTDKMDRCVLRVMADGHDKSSAIAICHNSILGRDFDPKVGSGGGTDRDKLPAEDFAGKDRSFPIRTPQDVADAARSLGRAGADNYDRETLKQNIIKIAKRKGQEYEAKLPAAWRAGHAAQASQDETDFGILFSHPDQTDMVQVNAMFGSLGEPELLKFEGARLCALGRNANGDGIDAAGLHELAATLPLMAITDEHATRHVHGFISAARVYEDQTYIDGLVWARRFPEVARDIQSGALKLSVEAFAEKATCSECGETFVKPSEYCAHLLGRRANGATRWLSGMKGVGAGTVREPAEASAEFDTNSIQFLAALQGEAEAPTRVPEPEAPVVADCHDNPPPAKDGTTMTIEELQQELDKVQAQLTAKEGVVNELQAKLDAAEAKAQTAEAALAAAKTASGRAIELFEAGFGREEVQKMEAALAGLDEVVFETLKATKAQVARGQAPVSEPAAKPTPTPATNPVLGGDQDALNLSELEGLFA